MGHQMKRQLWNILTIIIGLFFLPSCVSVKLGNEDIKKSNQVQYVSPSEKFRPIELKNADKAWQNKNTGTTLSFLSVCDDTADPSIESLQSSTLRGLDQVQVNSSDTQKYNNREAVRTVATGKVDGVSVQLLLMIFKKNSCNYTVSMVGLVEKIDTDKNEFDKFLEGFVAP